jgi:2-isopropylmalate synthase
VVRRAVESVHYARTLFDHVQWSAEDAARSEPDFLAEVVERVIEAGASTINIPDTVGYAVPSQFASIIAYLKKHVRGIDKVVLSVHCHNDLGLAVANSLGAVEQGARQVECTINGIGERAGNAALEVVVMALRTRHDYFHLKTNIRTERLYPTSRVLSNVTGLQVQRNKAIVGLNAFAHESGIHQHGVLAHRETYEIMRAEDVGFSSNRLVLGKHSGRALLKQRVKELGYQLDGEALDKLFEEVKVLADRKKEIFDADLAALIQGHITSDTPATWTLKALSTQSGTGTIPSAAVSLAHAYGREVREAACGDGPVDAVFKALERITGLQVRLTDYQVTAVTEGEEAQGQVTLDVEYQGETYRGMGASTDIILGSAYAFLEVINRIASLPERRATPSTPTTDVTLKASA